MKNRKLNGSVDRLAQAMRQVFQDSMENVRIAVKDDMDEFRSEWKKDLSSMQDQTNSNLADLRDELARKVDEEGKATRASVHTQLAEQNKTIGELSVQTS